MADHYFCDSGEKEIAVFGLDENGELVQIGKTNLFAEIQSHLDEVLLEKIIKRCSLTGEDLSASDSSFGDSTVLPKDLLEAKQNSNSFAMFESSLSPQDLIALQEKGFDKFLSDKIVEVQSQKNTSEVKSDE